MPGNSLLSLEPIQLEKVISKMKGISYIRLQQTCKYLEEFIRTNKYITVRFDEMSHVRPVYDEEKASWKFDCRLNNDVYLYKLTVEESKMLRNTQIKSFYTSDLVSSGSEEVIDSLFNYLKDLRITSPILYLRPKAWTKEQVVAFMQILQPEIIRMSCLGNHSYEAIFPYSSFKPVKEVSYLLVDEASAPIATEKLLSVIPKISMTYSCDRLLVACVILKNIFSKSWQNLQKYELTVRLNEDWKFYSQEMLENGLVGFKIEKEEGKENSYGIEMPKHFPSGSSCHIEVEAGEVQFIVEIATNL